MPCISRQFFVYTLSSWGPMTYNDTLIYRLSGHLGGLGTHGTCRCIGSASPAGSRSLPAGAALEHAPDGSCLVAGVGSR